jgi:ubiquitin-conjugating enzyme E2 F
MEKRYCRKCLSVTPRYKLQQKIKEQRSQQSTGNPRPVKKFSIRERLLTQELAEFEVCCSPSCKVSFPDANKIHHMQLTIQPEEGMWRRGRFVFNINVPEGYNIEPPSVKCLTKVWHPNIDSDGSVCLSILRSAALDGSGWTPTRSLKDVIWGLNSLFTDLCDFEDPLNIEAARQYKQDPTSFHQNVHKYIRRNNMTSS